MESSARAVKHERLEQLDALRAIAVLAVMYFHWLPDKYSFHLPLGDLGVTLFFVLSGYLITGILLSAKEKMGDGSRLVVIKSFVTRRTLRIFPIYYLLIGVSWLLSAGNFDESIIWNMLYLTNFYVYHTQNWPLAGGHLWTLSVEEQFYLIWPWLVLYGPRDYLLGILSGIFAVTVLVRFYLLPVYPAENFILVLPIPAFDALVVGAILAHLSSDKHGLQIFLWFCKYVALPVFVAMLALRIFGNHNNQAFVIFHIAMTFVFAMIIALAARGFGGLAGQILSSRPLRSIGTISYGLYLYHGCVPLTLRYLVVNGWLPEAFRAGWPFYITCLSTTLLIGYVSWLVIERPINALKIFFPYVTTDVQGSPKESGNEFSLRSIDARDRGQLEIAPAIKSDRKPG
jgi:peptidoglycan/LPS O-acetylase OafA/YrhL